MIVNGKHISQYLPRWISLNPLGSIHYVWRKKGWPLREVVAMWRDAWRSPNRDRTLATDVFGGEDDASSRFFAAAAHREYEEATEWYCVNGCCVVIWGSRKRGNMGGYGPAGCSCDDQDEPRDLARGPIPKRGQEPVESGKGDVSS